MGGADWGSLPYASCARTAEVPSCPPESGDLLVKFAGLGEIGETKLAIGA